MHDAVMLLALALDDRVRGTDRTCLYFRRGSSSGTNYRPKWLRARIYFWARYLYAHFWIWRTCRLPWGEKLLILPWVVVHAIRSQYSHPINRFVKRPLKRALRAVFLFPFKAVRGSR